MTQAELARQLGTSRTYINNAVLRKIPISWDRAAQFQEMTGIPARLWKTGTARNMKKEWAAFQERYALAQHITKETLA